MMLAVFFPSLMGVGIIASGAILLSDLVRKLIPGRGLRRRHRIAVGAYGVVAAVASSAGMKALRSSQLERVPRRRLAYTLLALTAASAGAAIALACAAAYRDELGLFHRSPWMIGIGIGAGAALGLLAMFVAVLAALGSRLPRPLAWVVATTSLGRLQIPAGLVVTSEASTRGAAP